MTEVEKLFKAVESGTLKVNQHNAERVKNVWATIISMNAALDYLGLADLPDPENVTDQYPKAFEDWLAHAYRGNFESEEAVRAALSSARAAIIKEALQSL